MEINGVYQAKPYSNKQYSDYKFLVVKNPSNTCSDGDLLRVAYHLRQLIGYSVILKEWFEEGKQNQKHLHLVIKKTQMITQEKLGKISSSFKRGSYRWTDIVQANEGQPEPTLIEWSAPLKNFIWHLSDFKNQHHFHYVLSSYSKKESALNLNEAVEFID